MNTTGPGRYCGNSEHDMACQGTSGFCTPGVSEASTPSLVRQFVEIKCAGARGERTTAARHNYLGVIVDELRRRNVLD